MVAGLTDMMLTPIPPGTAVPPQLTVYQSVVLPDPGSFTEIVAEAPEHRVVELALIPVGAAVADPTVTVTFWHGVTQPVEIFLVCA